MSLTELLEKEFYIVGCMDFTYFARPVHIVGMEGNSCDSEVLFLIDVPSATNSQMNREMYMYELERFKTFEEAQKEADRLNNIPSNKKRAKQWNTRDKFMLLSYLESKGE